MRTIIFLIFISVNGLIGQVSGTIYRAGSSEVLPYVNIWIKGRATNTL